MMRPWSSAWALDARDSPTGESSARRLSGFLAGLAGSCARSGHELELARSDDRSVPGDDQDRDRRPVATAAGDPRRLVRDVPVTPVHQREERNAQVAPLLRQAILEPL